MDLRKPYGRLKAPHPERLRAVGRSGRAAAREDTERPAWQSTGKSCQCDSPIFDGHGHCETCGRSTSPDTEQPDSREVVIDFLDAWRFCPVASSPNPSRQCLENAATQLLDALDRARGDTEQEHKR